MIRGTVTPQGLPQILLAIGGKEWPVTIDTGFNGDFELPAALRGHLNEQLVGVVESWLAGGRQIVEDCYLVNFEFDGRIELVEATSVESGDVLLGSGLPHEHLLTMDFPLQYCNQ